ncbi:hypothetical protein K456DRAFT_1461905 [Colletotrichum gloeosporioides 23]|nr:hypothetical protein K456DRAFT_1461905 [Colletotrichum gloeosporioides 23]
MCALSCSQAGLTGFLSHFLLAGLQSVAGPRPRRTKLAQLNDGGFRGITDWRDAEQLRLAFIMRCVQTDRKKTKTTFLSDRTYLVSQRHRPSRRCRRCGRMGRLPSAKGMEGHQARGTGNWGIPLVQFKGLPSGRRNVRRLLALRVPRNACPSGPQMSTDEWSTRTR